MRSGGTNDVQRTRYGACTRVHHHHCIQTVCVVDLCLCLACVFFPPLFFLCCFALLIQGVFRIGVNGCLQREKLQVLPSLRPLYEEKKKQKHKKKKKSKKQDEGHKAEEQQEAKQDTEQSHTSKSKVRV